jgi:hypothetical protein
MIRNAIRHGAIAVGATIASGAVAYAARGDAELVVYLVAMLALIFGGLAAASHTEAS